MAILSGDSTNNVLSGTTSADLISGGSGDDSLSGGNGNDLLLGGTGNDYIDGGSGNDFLFGGSGDDAIDGGNGNDFVDGGSGDDVINGGNGNDLIFGGFGNDILFGVGGADWMQGGAGNDVFRYLDASDSNSREWDRIIDFTQGKDKIDLSELLGQTIDLTWGDKTATANGAWYQNSGSSTFVFADTNNDGMADLKIELKNTFGLKLTASDLIGVGANWAPVVAAGAAQGDEDTVINGTLVASDSDGDSLNFSVVNGPAHGSLTVNADGTFSYTPAANFHGSDVFTYKVNDGASDSNVATVTLTVNAVNDAPVANDDGAITDEDASVTTRNVLANDSDVDNSLTAASITGFTQGANGTVVSNSDGTFTYTPDANFNGTDSFSYTVWDGVLSDTATVNVAINPVNDAPMAQPARNSTDKNSVLNGNNLTAEDVDGDLLQFRLVSVEGAPMESVTVHPSGTYQFDPRGLFDFLGVGASTDISFQYVTNDATVDSGPATVTITVNGANDAPVAMADYGNASDGGNVLTNDTDPDTGDNLNLKVASIGGMDVDGDAFVAGTFGSIFMVNNGTWAYVLDDQNPNTNPPAQDATDEFNYTMVDAHGATSSSTLTVHVTGTGAAPVKTSSTSSAPDVTVTDAPDTTTAQVAVADEANAVLAGTSGNVLANDMDLDTGDSLFVTEVNGNFVDGDAFAYGTYGSLFMTDVGYWSYTLNNAGTDALAQGASVDDVFGYTMADTDGASASSTLTIHIGDFIL